MKNYYVNDDTDKRGDHEVHEESCSFMPKNRTALGAHSSCHSAVKAARLKYSNSNGCFYCCRECHSS